MRHVRDCIRNPLRNGTSELLDFFARSTLVLFILSSVVAVFCFFASRQYVDIRFYISSLYSESTVASNT